MELRLDRDRCQGHGRCYVLAPDVFGSDDDGFGYVLADALSADFESQARAALMNCPEDAITLIERDRGDQHEEQS
jgi:ferredoxin